MPIPRRKWRDGRWPFIRLLEFGKRIDHIGGCDIKGIDDLQPHATVRPFLVLADETGAHYILP